jgi:hypothetical protein
VYFYFFAITSPSRKAIPFIWRKLNTLPHRMIYSTSGKIGPVVLEEKIIKMTPIFTRWRKSLRLVSVQSRCPDSRFTTILIFLNFWNIINLTNPPSLDTERQLSVNWIWYDIYYCKIFHKLKNYRFFDFFYFYQFELK